MPDLPSLAEQLKARREELGLSQAQVARELDVARTAYRLWELEAARPAPDRWRLVARWLGVSMSTLLLAEGLISEEEADSSRSAADRFHVATGMSPYPDAEDEAGDFFGQAHSMIDRSIERGIVTADEAGEFRTMFRRIERGLTGKGSTRPRPMSVVDDPDASDA